MTTTRSPQLLVTTCVQRIAAAVLKSSLLFHISGSLLRNPTGMSNFTNTFLLRYVMKSTRIFCCTSPPLCVSMGRLLILSADAFSIARFVITSTSGSKRLRKIKSTEKYYRCPAGFPEVAALLYLGYLGKHHVAAERAHNIMCVP